MMNAVASSAASGAECVKEKKEQFALCVGGSLVGETEEFKGAGALSGKTQYLIREIPSGFHVICAEEHTVYVMHGRPARWLRIGWLYLRCRPLNTKCKIAKEEFKTTELHGEVTKSTLLRMYPESGTTVATIKFESNEGTCLEAGELHITSEGKKEHVGPECRIPTAETEAEEHEMDCEEAHSHLEIGGSEVEISMSTALTVSPATKWSIIEGK
jgi:hypothetical protein